MNARLTVGGVTLPQVGGGFRERLGAVQGYHTGGQWVRAQGLSVADVHLGPRGLVPQIAFAVSPQAAHDALGRHDDALDKLTMFNLQRRLLGRALGRPTDDVFHMRYSPWLSRKRTLQPVFTKARVATYAGTMAEVAQDVVDRWTAAGHVDVAAGTRELTLEVLGRSVFGINLGSRASDLAPHVAWFMHYVLDRSLRPVRAPYWLPTPARSRLRTAWDVIDAISDEALDACRRDPEHVAPLIRQLLSAVDPETGASLTDEARRADLLAFLVAGHDTTATTLAYTLWQLGMNPGMQENVASEVAALGERPLTGEDLKYLPYTVQVIHEAMRLCPPAPGVARFATRDVEIDGHVLPQGYNVIVGIYALHRDPELWTRPMQFDPDRFDADRMRSLERWQYLPFGGGPRSCIGDHFAMFEAVLAVATVVRAARVTSLSPRFPLSLAVTLTAGEAVPVRFEKR